MPLKNQTKAELVAEIETIKADFEKEFIRATSRYSDLEDKYLTANSGLDRAEKTARAWRSLANDMYESLRLRHTEEGGLHWLFRADLESLVKEMIKDEERPKSTLLAVAPPMEGWKEIR